MLWRSLVPRRYGTPVSVRSPAFEGSVVLCQQDEFAEIVLSVVRDLQEKLGDQLSEEELRAEIKEALFQKAWARAGRKALARKLQDESSEES